MTVDRKLPAFPPAAKKPAAAGGLVAIALLAAVIGGTNEDAGSIVTDVQQHESGGRVYLTAYQDSVKIWTICDGIIRWEDGSAVRQGDTSTPERCQALVVREILPRAKALIACIPQLYGRRNQVRALIDLSYNAGFAGICNGRIGADIRRGDWADASAAILPWDRGSFPRPVATSGISDCRKKTAGGWSCRIRGLTARRVQNKTRFDLDRPAQGAR
jgi:GH24 family phage-related lysozyme (muramidase)